VEAIATDTAGQTARDSVTLTLHVDTTPPRLLAITPADQSVDVSIATPVQVTFSELIDHLGVRKIPSLLVLEEGQVVDRLEGRATGRQIDALIRPHLADDTAGEETA
jgi:hypothetical protein